MSKSKVLDWEAIAMPRGGGSFNEDDAIRYLEMMIPLAQASRAALINKEQMQTLEGKSASIRIHKELEELIAHLESIPCVSAVLGDDGDADEQ